MPVNYSKFDHIEDSDDEKPDAKTAALEEQRRMLKEQMEQKLAGSAEQDQQAAAAAEEAKGPHQTDRFSYGEADCQKLAHELLKQCIAKTPSVKVGNGVLSVAKIEKVEGDADMFQVRGEMRHTWDISFKALWCYQWMGANFDEGSQRAEGTISVCEFTDATTLTSDKSPPIIRKAWVDKGSLEVARQKEVEKALGGKPWPPAEGTLLDAMVKVLEVYAEELPKQTVKAKRQNKADREEAAQEEAEEFERAGGVLVEEVNED